MQSIKYLIVAVLAACAFECQAAQVPCCSDKLDLRLFVDNGAVICKNMFKAVNTGLDQCKPHTDKILNELALEAKELLGQLINDSRKKINDEDLRIEQIFATLTKALDNLIPIKTCSDKVSGTGKKLAHAAERDIVKAIKEVETKHKLEIDNLKVGAEKLMKKARDLFDVEVVAIVKCLAPGKKDANACLNAELNKITKGVTEIALQGYIFIQTSKDTFEIIMSEAIEKFLPLMEKYSTQFKVILKTLADCVGTLKP